MDPPLAQFFVRFGRTMTDISTACGDEFRKVDVADALTIGTLSSETRTKTSLERLTQLSTVIEATIAAMSSHRLAAANEFGRLIASLGLQDQEQYATTFERRVSASLAMELAELAAQRAFFQSTESILHFVQEQRADIRFDDVDILFSEQGQADAYSTLIGEWGACKRRARQVAALRDQYLRQQASYVLGNGEA